MKEDLITLWKITTKRRHVQFFPNINFNDNFFNI